MKLIVFIQSALLVIVTLLIIYIYRAQKPGTYEQSKLNSKPQKNNNVINRRNSFRIKLYNIKCYVKFLHLDDDKLLFLQNKSIDGYIEDISATGLKFISSYNIPLKPNNKI